jgi:hypothetical protein
MDALAGDLDPFGAWRDGVGHRRVGVELFAQLVEVGHLTVRAQLHLARGGRQLAQQRAQQRGLARAVGSDDADPVAALNDAVEVAQHDVIAVGDLHADQLGDQLAGFFAGVDFESGAADALAAGLALHAQSLQAAHAPFVAGAPRLDALADPDLFLGQHLVEACPLQRLGGELVGLALEIGGEVAGIAAQLAAVQFDDAGGHGIQEPPVVGDHQQRTAERPQHTLEPDDRLDVQVVGGFVQQQQFGLAHHGLGQCDALAHAARQGLHQRLAIEAEAGQDGVDAVGRAPGVMVIEVAGECAGDGLADAHARLESGLLWKIGDARAARMPDLAGIERRQAGQCLEQRRLAGAIAPDQADALAGFDRQVDPGQQGMVTVGELG